MPTMSVEDVVEIVAGLADEGVVVWVDGGWCIEALVVPGQDVGGGEPG